MNIFKVIMYLGFRDTILKSFRRNSHKNYIVTQLI